MVNLFTILHTLLSFLPLWFEMAIFGVVAILLVIVVFKIVAFVMDVIPFI